MSSLTYKNDDLSQYSLTHSRMRLVLREWILERSHGDGTHVVLVVDPFPLETVFACVHVTIHCSHQPGWGALELVLVRTPLRHSHPFSLCQGTCVRRRSI